MARRWALGSATLGSLLAPFQTVAPGTTFDGELVAVGQRDGRPTEDFAAVTRAVFTGKRAATDRLSYVAFDVLRGQPGTCNLAAGANGTSDCATRCRRTTGSAWSPLSQRLKQRMTRSSGWASRAPCSSARARRIELDDTTPGSSTRRGSPPTLRCCPSRRIATGNGTPSATSAVVASTRSLTHAQSSSSAGASNSSTRASTLTATCGRRASYHRTDPAGSTSGMTCDRDRRARGLVSRRNRLCGRCLPPTSPRSRLASRTSSTAHCRRSRRSRQRSRLPRSERCQRAWVRAATASREPQR